MKKITALLSATVLFVSLSAQEKKSKIDFVEYDLDNGLHVILHEDHSTPIVAVSVLYHVGSKNEDPKRTGFAHFFEHLLFEGSENVERGQFFKIVQGNGGVLNANTSFDRTFYYEVLPSNQLKLGLWLESERMLHAKIDEEGVETQRGVVKEERKQRYENTPYGTILPEMMKRAFNEHPYRWTPIGEAQYIDQAKLSEFMDFYKVFYVPNNATLSIAGDINIEETKKMIKDYFGGIPKGTQEIPRPDIVEPKQTAEVRDTIYDNVQLPGVIMGYHMPAQGEEEYYAMSMLAQYLSQGESSRFNKIVKEEKEKALFAGAFPIATEDPGVALMFGIANMGVAPDELEKAMNEEIALTKKELISEKEFQKLRNQIESDFISGNATVRGLAENLANYHVYYGDANLVNTEIDRYMKVSREDIKAAANKYLNDKNRVVLYYLPKSQQPN